MIWFKHDSNAATDAKIKKLLIKYGAEGYAIYFHCIELIVSDISESNITFVLEHDSEIIADDLKIRGTSDQSGQDRVNQIMKYIIQLGLFEENNGRISCYKILKRLDSSMTSNVKMRKLIVSGKSNHDKVMTQHDIIMQEEKRIDKKRREEKRYKPPAKSQAITKIHPLYQSINESFLSKNGGSYTSYPKEGKAINQLIAKCEQRYPENTGDFIRALIEQYYKMVFSTDKFWSDQPFLPSTLNSSGIFDRVLKKLQVKDTQDINIQSLEGIPW